MAAHSNVAVDLLVKDLIKYIPKGQIKRLASEARMRIIPDEIRDYATSNADVIPLLRDLRILCGTLGILGKATLYRVSLQLSYYIKAVEYSNGTRSCRKVSREVLHPNEKKWNLQFEN